MICVLPCVGGCSVRGWVLLSVFLNVRDPCWIQTHSHRHPALNIRKLNSNHTASCSYKSAGITKCDSCDYSRAEQAECDYISHSLQILEGAVGYP